MKDDTHCAPATAATAAMAAMAALCRPLAAAAVLLGAAPAHAGGHFDVDDAGTLDAGQCQYELWGGRTRGDPAVAAIHLGPACGIGQVEVGVDLDRVSASGNRSVGLVGPRAKWTFYGREDDARVSAAISGGLAFDVSHGGRTGGQVALPVSWNALDSLQLSVNLGYDWLPGPGTRTGRGGAQAVWSATDVVMLVAERNRAFGLWTSRIGTRLALTPRISIDLSVARTATNSAGNVRTYTVGLNQTFGGP